MSAPIHRQNGPRVRWRLKTNFVAVAIVAPHFALARWDPIFATQVAACTASITAIRISRRAFQFSRPAASAIGIVAAMLVASTFLTVLMLTRALAPTASRTASFYGDGIQGLIFGAFSGASLGFALSNMLAPERRACTPEWRSAILFRTLALASASWSRYMFQHARHLFTAILLVPLLSSAAAEERPAKITAATRQRIHPVLIRNDRNALLEVKVESDQGDVFLHSLTFSLAGTDDRDDIESLQVFSPGEKQDYATRATFGDAQRPGGGEIVIRGNVRLRRGTNVFWLSCRLNAAASLSHKVDATCTRIDTSAGPITPKDTSPGVRKRIGVALRRHFDDGVHTYRIPALATTPQGTLLCVYDMRRRARRDLQEDIDIGLLRSTDGGQSWEAQRVIMDMGEYGGLPQEQNGCSDPGITVDAATGQIFVGAVWTWGRPGTHQWNKGGSGPGFDVGESSQFLMVRSADDGRTWSAPENLTRKLKRKEWILFAPSPQQGLTLADGTLVMPSQGRDAQDRFFSNLMISRDHGQTWSLSNPASLGNTECQAVVLGDGSIMLNCRTERPTKYRTVMVTSDLGKTWRPHETNRIGLIEPNCNGSTYRFDYQEDGEQKHILVFANPHSQTARDHHSIQISFDDGRTWPDEYRLLLDEGGGAGYPSLSRVDDEHLALVYEGSQSQLVFERFSLAELLRRE